jgi:hypothetical protein
MSAAAAMRLTRRWVIKTDRARFGRPSEILQSQLY